MSETNRSLSLTALRLVHTTMVLSGENEADLTYSVLIISSGVHLVGSDVFCAVSENKNEIETTKRSNFGLVIITIYLIINLGG